MHNLIHDFKLGAAVFLQLSDLFGGECTETIAGVHE
jgi:hypothetical protein